MLEFDEVMPFYICDRCLETCAECDTCGGDYCNHTTLPNHAANKESVELLNKFLDKFIVQADDYGRLVCIEKG